jgi:hypothetical protein
MNREDIDVMLEYCEEVLVEEWEEGHGNGWGLTPKQQQDKVAIEKLRKEFTLKKDLNKEDRKLLQSIYDRT